MRALVTAAKASAISPTAPAAHERSHPSEPLPRAVGEAPARLDLSRTRVANPRPQRIQPSFALSASGTDQEREADRIADAVTRPEGPPQGADVGPAPPVGEARSHYTASVPSVVTRADSAAHGGSPLPPTIRAWAERRLGFNFDAVRVFADDGAARRSERVGARAFTYGSSVYFGAGQFAPHTPPGRRLIAHELTHVMQQMSRPRLIQAAPLEQGALDPGVDALKATLKTSYALADVLDGDAAWTLVELKAMAAALKLLPDADKKALVGATLKRVHSAGPSLGGRFDSSQGFSNPEHTEAFDQRVINMADLAFDPKLFDSQIVLLHEVGHAVDEYRRRKAVHDTRVAQAEKNKLVEQKETTATAIETTQTELDKSKQPLSDAEAELKEANKTVDVARQKKAQAAYSQRLEESNAKRRLLSKLKDTKADLLNKIATAEGKVVDNANAMAQHSVSPKVVEALKSDADLAKKAHAKALSAAEDDVKKLTAAAKKASSAYRTAVRVLSDAIDAFASATASGQCTEAEVDQEADAVEALIDARDKEHAALAAADPDGVLKIYSGVEAKQQRWFRSVWGHGLARFRSQRLQDFVEFVESTFTKRGKPIPFPTPYTKDSWPHKPGELFAETYAWFRKTPQALKALSPQLYGYLKENYKQ
ncbi:MAG TPA: DUF4157 domain-containing protein [Candidatus Elarobacter sp.]|jgi:hypothetical protein